MPKLNPVKSVPWVMVAQTAMRANEHWKELTEAERSKLKRLIAKSKGMPRNLTAKERAEARKLIGKLDLVGLGRDMLPLGGGRRRKRKK